MARDLIDTQWRIETAEGVTLTLTPAGLVPRAYAYAIDLAIRCAIFVALIIVMEVTEITEKFGAGLLLLVAFALEWFYPVVFEALRGRTPGKAALGLRVVTTDGAPIGFGASLLRNLLRVTDFFPFGYALGAIMVVATPRLQRFGDLVAGALVVHEGRVEEARSARAAGPAAPLSVPLDVDEQRAVISFAHRRELLGARADELALLTGDATQGDASARTAALVAAARWYEGRR